MHLTCFQDDYIHLCLVIQRKHCDRFMAASIIAIACSSSCGSCCTPSSSLEVCTAWDDSQWQHYEKVKSSLEFPPFLYGCGVGGGDLFEGQLLPHVRLA